MASMITGRIYIIRSPNTEMVYVGSTTSSLKVRFQIHLCDWRRKDSRRCPTSVLIIDEGGAYIELLEEVQVESERELEMIEQRYIDSIPNTVNKRKAYCSEEDKKKRISEYHKKHYETHKEELHKQKKIYYETHKEELLKQKKIYYETHKEELHKQQKKHYETHKEQINEKRREKIRCEVCDVLITKRGMLRHERSKKHQKHKNYVAEQ